MGGHVKVFTCHPAACACPGTTAMGLRDERHPVPHRTIRRVFVMPWATPVRRIGLVRLSGDGANGDDHANLV